MSHVFIEQCDPAVDIPLPRLNSLYQAEPWYQVHVQVAEEVNTAEYWTCDNLAQTFGEPLTEPVLTCPEGGSATEDSEGERTVFLGRTIGQEIFLRQTFPSEDEAVLHIDKWCEETYCPFVKIGRRKPHTNDKGVRIRGQRRYKCSGGIERKSKATFARPYQNVKFVGCMANLNINEQEDGSWMITSFHLEHTGHSNTPMNFLSQNKQLSREDQLFVSGLKEASASNSNIADVLTKKTGKPFKAQDVFNIVTQINKGLEGEKESIEEVLAQIKEDGGDAKWKKKDGSNDVKALLVQTATMKANLARSKPMVFETDTTFGTQEEGYKLWAPIYFDQFTGKWEVAGLVFLATEIAENVEAGIRFFYSSLTYRAEYNNWIFFCDKDFDYIGILETVFPGARVLLCNVHTSRYFKEKVLTNKAFRGDINEHQYLGKADKDTILDKLIQVRDSKSEEQYREKEMELLSYTENLSVRPSQTEKPVYFKDYYFKNWKTIVDRWVAVFRKNLPLHGTKDTQASEATFSVIKRFIKRKFPGRCPKLVELVSSLTNYLDKRSAERDVLTSERTLQFNHSDPEINANLKNASKYLNVGGYKRLVEEIHMEEKRRNYIKLEGNQVTETYEGKSTKGYIGKYQTDGITCSCSWMKEYFLCRHQIHFRIANKLPLFELSMFQNSHRKTEYQDDDREPEIGFSSSNLGSPGMDSFIEEEQNKRKRIKPNVRYNKAFDATKPLTEYLAMQDKTEFVEQLETVKEFTELMRIGFPQEIKDLIHSHYLSSSSSSSSTLPNPVQFHPSELVNVREEHRADLDGWILRFPGASDGTCLDSGLSTHIYEDPSHVLHVKRMRHRFILDQWWYFGEFFPLPFTETVGVGPSSHQVFIDNYEDLKLFLQSDESLYLYASSQVDIAAIASLFHINVWIYTYNVQALDHNGQRQSNRWTVVSPDPLVSQFSPCQPDQIPDICLYLEDSVHYDLLVREDSRLALQGTVSKRLEDIMKPKLQHVPEQSISSPALRRLNLVQSHSISPMNFPACPKGRGRPKVTKRQGAPIRTDQPEKRKFNTQQEEEEPFSFVPDCLRQFSIPQPPKKRGRPKGSKNKEQTKRTLVETSYDIYF